jgi:hypothetical protein
MPKLIDITGYTYGRLIVLNRGPNKNKRTSWKCVCSCGTIITVLGLDLKSGSTKSCGCFRKETTSSTGKKNTVHGKSKSVEFKTWDSMLQRCLNSNYHGYKYYGGRGITVCERWKNSFQNFLEDMGEKPKGLSLDRINNNGNYEPNNCKWATHSEQMSNRRKWTK